ncbi:MAG: TRAP transporter small permease, partial [Gemmatimonadota bacterium]|nr:TRAP transporter small permease [Gemmatimonadota bacterium]
MSVTLETGVPDIPQPRGRVARLALRIEHALAWAVEVPAAILVVVEIGVLFAGVVSRYAFHQPLVWSDELASILFMWLAMLGAVVAFEKSAHMRMTALVSRLSPERRAWAEAAALIVPIAFLALLFPAALEYAKGEMDIVTPALEIANAWRAAALPIGIALMGVFALLQLVERATWVQALVTAVVALAIVLGLLALASYAPGVFASLGRWNLVLFFVVGVGAMVLSG